MDNKEFLNQLIKEAQSTIDYHKGAVRFKFGCICDYCLWEGKRILRRVTQAYGNELKAVPAQNGYMIATDGALKPRIELLEAIIEEAQKILNKL